MDKEEKFLVKFKGIDDHQELVRSLLDDIDKLCIKTKIDLNSFCVIYCYDKDLPVIQQLIKDLIVVLPPEAKIEIKQDSPPKTLNEIIRDAIKQNEHKLNFQSSASFLDYP